MKELMGKTFTAKLSCTGGPHQGAVIFSQDPAPGASGWLQVLKDASRAATLKFTFLKTTGNRHEYAITGADNTGYYAKAALGLSFNNYLGMYHKAAVENVWSVELGADRVNAGAFWLRDKEGHPVLLRGGWEDTGLAIAPSVPGIPLLNLVKGDVARFLLIDPRVV